MVDIIKDLDKKRQIDKFLERAYETNQKSIEESKKVKKTLVEIFEMQKKLSKGRDRKPSMIEEFDLKKFEGISLPKDVKELSRTSMMKIKSEFNKQKLNADVIKITTDDKFSKILNMEIKKGGM